MNADKIQKGYYVRKIYTYRVVRYFPSSRSDEFFNVGVVVQDDKGQSKSLYIDEFNQHIKCLRQFPSINKKALPFFLKVIRQEKNSQAWYDNNLRFSELDTMICEQSIDEVANMLYEDYIGYKFHTKDIKYRYKKDRYKEIRETTKIVFEKKFQSKLILEELSEQSFFVINKRTNKKHFGRFGSVDNKQDIKELMYFSLDNDNYKKMGINFLGIISSNDDEIKSCKERFLTPNHIVYFPYTSEEETEIYLELASA